MSQAFASAPQLGTIWTFFGIFWRSRAMSQIPEPPLSRRRTKFGSYLFLLRISLEVGLGHLK
jgi:hypothetical protein